MDPKTRKISHLNVPRESRSLPTQKDFPIPWCGPQLASRSFPSAFQINKIIQKKIKRIHTCACRRKIGTLRDPRAMVSCSFLPLSWFSRACFFLVHFDGHQIVRFINFKIKLLKKHRINYFNFERWRGKIRTG